MPALLQRPLPRGGTEMVALEGPAPIPCNRSGPAETERPKPTLPGTRQKPETTRARGRWRGSEGNHYRRIFSGIPATGRAATNDSYGSGDLLCSVSARMRADAHWSASKSENAAGSRRAFNPDILSASEIRLTFSLSMRLEFHQLDLRWEHLRVRHPGRQRRVHEVCGRSSGID
jgi:hypothetical protein